MVFFVPLLFPMYYFLSEVVLIVLSLFTDLSFSTELKYDFHYILNSHKPWGQLLDFLRCSRGLLVYSYSNTLYI